MAGMSIIAKLGLSSKDFSQALTKVEKEGTSFATKFGSALKSAMKVAGTAIAGFATKGAVDFASFEKGITEVFTLIPDAGKKAFKQLEDGVRSLSTEMGVDLNDAVKGLYQALSAGIPADNAIDFLRTASKASIAGVATLETSVGALTTILNGYGMEATEAGKVSDVLFSVVKQGVTNFTELGQNVGKVTPIASALGVSIEELASMFVTLTKQMGAGKTAEAGTALRSMLAELGKEGMKASKNFQELGLGTFPQFIASGGKVTDALKLMKDNAEKNNKTLMDMFRGVEAGNGALMVMTQNGEMTSEALKGIAKDAGAVDVAFGQLDATTSADFAKLTATLKDLSIEFGSAFIPLIKELLPDTQQGLAGAKDSIKAFGDSVAQIVRFVKDFAVEIGILVAGIATYKAGLILADVATIAFGANLTGLSRGMKGLKIAMGALLIGDFTKAIGGATIALKAIGAVLVANPIGILIAGLTAVIAPIVLFKKELADMTELAKEGAKQMREKLIKEVEDLGDKAEAGKKRIADLDAELAKLQEKRDLQINPLPPIEDVRDFFDLLKDQIKLDKDRKEALEIQIKLQKQRVEKAQEDVELQKKINAEYSDQADAEKESLVRSKYLNQEIIKLNAEEEKLKKLMVEELGLRVKIGDQVDLLVAEREKEWQVSEDIKKAIEDTNRAYQLSLTEAGKITLEQEKIKKLEEEKKELIQKAKDARVLEAGEAQKLIGIEKEILGSRKKIADIIKDQMIQAHQDEIKKIDDKKQVIEKLLQTEKDRLEVVQDAKEAKDKEVQALRDGLAEAEKELDKFRQFFKKDFNGKLRINTSELVKEFNKLKRAGTLPNNVKTIRDYKTLIQEQAKLALATRDDIIKKGKIAFLEQQKLHDAEKTALQNKQTIEAQINAKKQAIINKEQAIEDIKAGNADKLVDATDEMASAMDSMRDFKIIPPQIPGTLVDAVNTQSQSLDDINRGVSNLLNKPNKIDDLDKVNKEATQQQILDKLGGFFVNQ